MFGKQAVSMSIEHLSYSHIYSHCVSHSHNQSRLTTAMLTVAALITDHMLPMLVLIVYWPCCCCSHTADTADTAHPCHGTTHASHCSAQVWWLQRQLSQLLVTSSVPTHNTAPHWYCKHFAHANTMPISCQYCQFFRKHSLNGMFNLLIALVNIYWKQNYEAF